MSKRKLSSSSGKSRKKRISNQKKLKKHRFLGVCLTGTKNGKTCVCALDYFPQYQKLFLTEFFDDLEPQGDQSGDEALLEVLNKKDNSIESITFDVPITLPYGFNKKIDYSSKKSTSKVLKWHWSHYRKTKRKKKTHKMFCPYTERCVDVYIRQELEEPFAIPPAMGSNLAPLTARSLYLRQHVSKALLECFPKLTFWRVGLALKVAKSHLRFYKHSQRGDMARSVFLDELLKKEVVFMYDQDILKLLGRPNYFDAFLAALTGYLKFQNETEKPPKGFPKQEGWVEIPQKNLTLPL